MKTKIKAKLKTKTTKQVPPPNTDGCFMAPPPWHDKKTRRDAYYHGYDVASNECNTRRDQAVKELQQRNTEILKQLENRQPLFKAIESMSSGLESMARALMSIHNQL